MPSDDYTKQLAEKERGADAVDLQSRIERVIKAHCVDNSLCTAHDNSTASNSWKKFHKDMKQLVEDVRAYFGRYAAARANVEAWQSKWNSLRVNIRNRIECGDRNPVASYVELSTLCSIEREMAILEGNAPAPESPAPVPEKPSRLPSERERPHGLHQRYVVTKASGEPVDDDALYFVLRIDGGGDDPCHIMACREAAKEYARAIISDDDAHHLWMMARDLMGEMKAIEEEEDSSHAHEQEPSHD